MQRNQDASLRVLVIWEPILPTDWARPGSGVLSRISDRRAIQFWDRGHLFAQELRRDLEAQRSGSDSDCCSEFPERGGVFWDMVAVYPKGAHWTSSLPPPVFIGGAVFDVRTRLEKSLAAPVSRMSPAIPVYAIRLWGMEWETLRTGTFIIPVSVFVSVQGRHIGEKQKRIGKRAAKSSNPISGTPFVLWAHDAWRVDS